SRGATMRCRVLAIFLGDQRIGHLFQYGDITRLNVDVAYATSAAPKMSVVDEPMEDGFSLSGMQPKLSLVSDGKRFVVTRHFDGGHVIGKLPVASYERLPQVEHLSLALARAAGAHVCAATLQPMSLIDRQAPLVDGRDDYFLAVQRFDRDVSASYRGRRHVEDFAQVFGVDPMDKYTGAAYSDVAKIMLDFPGLGEGAVMELFRRLAINELLGNFDMHLKNIGILHTGDGSVALSPAYDIVALSVYVNGNGHALKFTPDQEKSQELSPKLVRAFSDATGMAEPRLRAVVRDVCSQALETWPAMVAASDLLPAQKDRLIAHMMSRPVIRTLLRRQPATG
ncbi:MAG: HipA domain-containing protein, partial [Duganella sp.]